MLETYHCNWCGADFDEKAAIEYGPHTYYGCPNCGKFEYTVQPGVSTLPSGYSTVPGPDNAEVEREGLRMRRQEKGELRG